MTIYKSKVELNSEDDFVMILPDELMLDLKWHIGDELVFEINKNIVYLTNKTLKERENGNV